MATTAQIKLLSTDLVDQGMSVDLITNLYQAAGTDDIVNFTGTNLVTLPSAGSPATLKIVDKTLFTNDKSAKVYIYNAEPTSTPDDYLIVELDSVVMGRLYPGDWCFFPYDGDQDVNVTPKASTEVKIEHAVLGDL